MKTKTFKKLSISLTNELNLKNEISELKIQKDDEIKKYNDIIKSQQIKIDTLSSQTESKTYSDFKALKEKNPDVKKIVDDLRKVKTLKSNEPVLVPSPDFVIQKNSKAIFVKSN